MHKLVKQARAAAARVRHGLIVFRRPRLGTAAVSMQLGAWAVQCASCYVLLVALGLDAQGADFGAAAAVLFAVNVTAVLPRHAVQPRRLPGRVRDGAHGAYGIGTADALGYGIILQAVEVATAVIMGAPALVKEGVSWREIRLRALHTTPVELSHPPGAVRAGARS